MNNEIKQFINGIDEVSNYTLDEVSNYILTGTSQFSEVTKLTLVKNFLTKVFQYTDIDKKLTDSVMFHDFVLGYVVIFTNEIKREAIAITINEQNLLTSVTLNKI